MSARPLIGLTGGIGSGKSTVADAFAALGAGVVDTDAIAHALTAPGGAAMPAIEAGFGPGVVTPDGALDRAAMRRLVFDDPASRRRLEAILHPMIAAETARALDAAPGAYRIVVVPLLVETGHWLARVDRVAVVDCPESVQVERVMRRSGLDAAQVRAILAAQATRAQRLAHADDVIDNAGTPDALGPVVARLHERWSTLAPRAR